jgi:hypothetical protein
MADMKCLIICITGISVAMSACRIESNDDSKKDQEIDSGINIGTTLTEDNEALTDSGLDCRGPGRYESGKEGSYRPCCSGLTEVFYKKPGYSDGEKVCMDIPLRVYACVSGHCGDGICEEGESEACGCVEDCPSAVWETQDKAAKLASNDKLVVEVRVLDQEQRVITEPIHIVVVSPEEYYGEIPNGSGPVFSFDESDGQFSVEVPPGRWGIIAYRGTSNTAPLVEIEGKAGDRLSVELLMKYASPE